MSILLARHKEEEAGIRQLVAGVVVVPFRALIVFLFLFLFLIAPPPPQPLVVDLLWDRREAAIKQERKSKLEGGKSLTKAASSSSSVLLHGRYLSCMCMPLCISICT